MFRRTLSLSSMLLPLLACGGSNPSGSSTGDLTFSQVFSDVAPAVCSRVQQCDPAAYAQAFPNGEPDCAALFDESDTDPGAVVECTQEHATRCGNDIQNEACSLLIPEAGTPTLPSSCNGC
jgi:hypothetical protein